MPDAEWLAEQFDRCRPWLEDALAHSAGTHGIEDVREIVMTGGAQLWPTPNAVAVTLVETFPRFKAVTFWLAGGDLEELRGTHERVLAWAKRQGCTKRLISGRRGWLRSLGGYRETSTQMAGDI